MNTQPETLETNNPSSVKDILSKKLVPLLPNERASILRQLEEMSVTQDELGVLLGDAMQQSSETWHDNAPADAINQESRALEGRARKLLDTLRNAVDIDYPEEDIDQVTVGTLASLVFAGDPESAHFYITGGVRDLEIEGMEDGDITVVTASSPIGNALLGKAVGESAEFVGPREKTLTVTIVDVNQIKF